MTKPICFSYKDYTDMREEYEKLLAETQDLRSKVQKQADEVNRLKEENTNLKIHVRILEEDRRNDKGIRR